MSVIVNDAHSYLFQPAMPSEYVPGVAWFRRKIYGRVELITRYDKRHCMPISSEGTIYSSHFLPKPCFYVQSQCFAVLTSENAETGARVHLSRQPNLPFPSPKQDGQANPRSVWIVIEAVEG